jgi:hypothetical protein
MAGELLNGSGGPQCTVVYMMFCSVAFVDAHLFDDRALPLRAVDCD